MSVYSNYDENFKDYMVYRGGGDTDISTAAELNSDSVQRATTEAVYPW